MWIGDQCFFVTLLHIPWLPCGFAMVPQAHDLGIISRKHYAWWYDEMIKKNPREEGWRQYDIAETIGRENRIKSIAEKGIPRTQ